MSNDTIQTLGKYLIAVSVIVGCFVLIYTAKATDTQPWTVIGLIVGWIVRDSAGQQATTNAVNTLAAVTSAPIPSATITPLAPTKP